VTWAFSRDLLLDGIVGPSGDGDVHISPTGPEELSDLAIRLQVGEDCALFQVSAAPVVAFLDRTDRLVPLGQERAFGDFEQALERALVSILAEENAG
jgi:hypothetical protein